MNNLSLLLSQNSDKVKKLPFDNLIDSFVSSGVINTDSNNGPQGPPGPTGTVGAPGVQGVDGLTGFQGIDGQTGLQGFQGFQGNDIQGPTGPQGATGAQGTQGAVGSNGSNVAGPAGPPGPAGPQGDPGGLATSYLQLNDTPGSFGSIPYAVIAVNVGETGISHTNDRIFNTSSALEKSTNSVFFFGDNADRIEFFNSSLINSTQILGMKSVYAAVNRFGLYTENCTRAWLFDTTPGNSVNPKNISGSNIITNTQSSATIPTISANYSTVIDSAGSYVSTNRGTILNSISSNSLGSFSTILNSVSSSIGLNGSYCSIFNSDNVSMANGGSAKFSSIINSHNSSFINGNYSAIIGGAYNKNSYSNNYQNSISNNYSAIIGSRKSIVGGQFSTVLSGSYNSTNNGKFCSTLNCLGGAGISSSTANYCFVMCSNNSDISGTVNSGGIIHCDDCNIYSSGSPQNFLTISNSYSSYITAANYSYILGSRNSKINTTANGNFLNVISSDDVYIGGTTPKFSSILASHGSSTIRYSAEHAALIATNNCRISDSTTGNNGDLCSMISCSGSGTPTLTNAGYACSQVGIVGFNSAYGISSGTSFRLRVRRIVYNSLTCISDRRRKKDIKPVSYNPDILTKISKIKLYMYRMNNNHPDMPPLRGFIAQEVDKYFPQFIEKEHINKIKVFKDSKSQVWKKDVDQKHISESDKVYIDQDKPEEGYIIEKNPVGHLSIDSYFVPSVLWRGIQEITKRKKIIDDRIEKIEMMINELKTN